MKLIIEKILHNIIALLRYYFVPVVTMLPVKKTRRCDVVIVRTDGIGDFVMWAGVISNVRAHYQGRKITYICPSNYLSLVEALGLFDEVIPVDKKKFETEPFYQIKFIRQMKQICADIVINPVKSRIYPSDYIVRAIKAKEKIGAFKGECNIYRKDKYYTKLFDIPSEIPEMKYTECFTQQLIGEQYQHKLADFSSLVS